MKRLLLTFVITVSMVLGYALPDVNPEAQVFAYTSKTQDEAIEWVESQLGTGIDYDGVYGNQCVDLIKAYYAALGVSAVKGNGCDYATNSLPDGWSRVQGGKPERGDILVYSGNDSNPYGHVAIYANDYETYHQNFNSHPYVEKVTIYSYNGLSNGYWGYIRPDWAEEPAPQDPEPEHLSVTSPEEPVDIGESCHLYAAFSPEGIAEDKTGIIWESSNPDIAVVDESGVVSGISEGMVIITATSVYNDSIWCECNVEVKCRHRVTEVRNARSATANADGYTGDTCCLICGNVVSEGEVIPKTGGNGTGGNGTSGGNVSAGGNGTSAGNAAANVLPAGSKAAVNGCTYTVISSAPACVEFTKSVNSKTVSVPNHVTLKGRQYKVTRVGAGAFKGKKIRTVNVGANVAVIKAGAFSGSKATKIVLKTKILTKKGVSKSLKGSKVKTIQVKAGNKKVNKSLVKKYKGFFAKKNSGAKVKIR